MSALGQKRTFAVQKGMSALPPKADISDGQFLSEIWVGRAFAGDPSKQIHRFRIMTAGGQNSLQVGFDHRPNPIADGEGAQIIPCREVFKQVDIAFSETKVQSAR